MPTEITIVQDPGGDYLLKPGQVFWAIAHPVYGVPKPHLFICCPKCGKTAGTTMHKFTIDELGKVTLSPSLACPIKPCDAHYYIENNRIRWC